MIAGDIATKDGDIYFSNNLAISQGLLLVSFEQALKAIPHNWRWMEVSPDGVGIQRGSIAIKSVKL